MQTRLPSRITGSPSIFGQDPAVTFAKAEKKPAGVKSNSGVGISGFVAQHGLIVPDRRVLVPEPKRLITPQRTLAPIGMALAASGNTDADPVTHLNFLAGPECAGRGSPSEGYDKASAYMADLMKKYGLLPANPGDPSGNPYYQTFSLYSRGILGDQAVGLHKGKWGHSAFERGFFLDDTLTDADKQAIRNTVSRGKPNIKGIDLTPEGVKKAGFSSSNVQNVMGIIPGSGPHKDEYIVMMCHLDHLGVKRGQTYWGADDNASGSSVNASAIPGLAKMAQDGKLDRSILVIFTAAEEEGLLGASYVVRHPPSAIGDKSKIKGAFNNDMVGRLEVGRISAIPTTENKRTFLTDCFERSNELLGDRKFHVDYDLQEYESRQDGWAFTHAGIPTSFLYEGLVGGEEMPDYHKPTDTIDKIIRDNGGEKIRRLRDLTTYAVQLACNTAFNPDGTWTLPKSV